jgi:ubiquinone/menaquinone biosynthesis C-methylase UbiE
MTVEKLTPEQLRQRNEKIRRSKAKQAPHYDRQMGFFERRLLGGDHREWACSRASGDTLEVAVGTALNLPHYGQDVRLTGLDLSPEMLQIARERAARLGKEIDLHEGDAHELPFPDSSFDTIVCTYSLCNIPDPGRAVAEMKRVLRPEGQLILVDHIRSAVKPIFWFQKGIEFLTTRLEGEHLTRRPLEQVKTQGFDVRQRDRLGLGGIVERLIASKASGIERNR